MLKNKEGISLLTLVLTIVTIMIIAYISIFSGIDTQETAVFSKFSDEVDSLRVSLGIYRAQSLVNFDDENHGFKPVKLINAPDNFVSFSGDSSDTGYVIDISLLDYRPEIRGKGNINVSEVTFGKDDVFIYDKNGRVYYVQGYENDERIYYNATTFE